MQNGDETQIAPEHGATASPLRVAVATTIKALVDAKLIEPRHTAMCQLALELADSVTSGRRSGRASAAAMAAAQLRETLMALPEPTAAGAQEKFDRWVESLSNETAE